MENKAKSRDSEHLEIDKEKCKGCGYCVEFCPQKVLATSSELSPKGYTLPMVSNIKKCLSCSFCETICPEFAIKLSEDLKALGTDADNTP